MFKSYNDITLELIKSKVISTELNDQIQQKLINLFECHYTRPDHLFKKGDRCIRVYSPGKEQSVVICQCSLQSYTKGKGYSYEYDYYPSSDGWGNERNLRKLTEKEEKMEWYLLPHSMEADPIWWND